MEAVVIHQSDHFCMEPLNSYVDIFELYIGNISIWNETLSNLFYSGVNKVYLLVESYKLNKYNHLSTYNKVGGKESKIKVEVVGLNVKLEVGTALREFFRIHGPMEPFVLLFSNTLLTVPLTESIDFHIELTKSNSSYCMTVLYVEDEKKRFSDLNNSSVILFDEKNELLHSSNDSVIKFESEFLNSIKSDQINIRYDLFQSSVYLCTNLIIETFLELFDKESMEQLITEMLTEEIKTSEMYIYVVKNDLSFPEYPSILRVETPRDYYNVYMSYVSRFTGNNQSASRVVNSNTVSATSGSDPGEKDYYGPLVNKNSYFINNSVFSSLPVLKEQMKNLQGNVPLTSVDELFKALNSSVTGCLVGSGVKMGSDCKITNSIIFNNVTIGNNCEVDNTIIMNNVTIGDGVTLESGSLIGPCCVIDRGLVIKSTSKVGVRCATMKTKFYDLTVERNGKVDNITDDSDDLDSSKCGIDEKGNLWEVGSFITNPLHKIGSEYYDYVTFTMPDSAETTSNYDYDSECEYGSEIDSRYGSDSDSEYVDSENKGSDYGSDDEVYGKESEPVTEEFKDELVEMVHEALEDPKNLDNKLLEIRSLRVAHNVTEQDTLNYIYVYGIEWVIQKFNELNKSKGLHGSSEGLRVDSVERKAETNEKENVVKDLEKDSDVNEEEDQEEDLVEEKIKQLIRIVESSQINELLESFSSKLKMESYYSNTLNMCNKYGKSQLFFCQMCEALYHTDVLEFEGFQKWLSENNLKEDRLVSFAKWVES